MFTPWGTAQSKYKLAVGVYWVSTAGHGGLMVGSAVAREKLSDDARRCALPFGRNWFCFEEDCQYAIAFYERPEWAREMDRQSCAEWQAYLDGTAYDPYGLKAQAPERIRELNLRINSTDEAAKYHFGEIVRRWHPEFFAQPPCDCLAGRTLTVGGV